jgi:hypothetical protein
MTYIQSSPYFSTTRFHEYWIRSTVPFLFSTSLILPEIYLPVFVFVTQKKNHEVQKGKNDVINFKPRGQAEMKKHSDDVTVFCIAKLTRATLAADWLAPAT